MAFAQRFIKRPLTLKRSLALIGSALFTGSLATIPVFGQNRSNTPYCFVVKDDIRVSSRPAAGTVIGDRFNENDIAYATANPPRTVISGGQAFVEVAIYGGNKAWLPRTSTIDGVPLIVDLTTDQCTNPPANAAGGNAIGSGPSMRSQSSDPYCFAVQTPVNVYSRPSTDAMTGDRYNARDIAYATTNPPTAVRSVDTVYIEVAIHDNLTGWVPRRPADDAAGPFLVDLTTNQCVNPPANAAGSRVGSGGTVGGNTETPYCFVVKDDIRVSSRPAAGAVIGDRFNENDIAYATANPPRTVISGGQAFVEVAIYGGNKAWLPRTSTIDGVPLIVDLTPDQCTNPGPGAAGA